MGSFDWTCAFSRTAISYGDEILLVALSTYENLDKSTYGLLFTNVPIDRKYRFIGIGNYNDYGTIDEFENDVSGVEGNWWDYQFMVHSSVAEGLLGKPLKTYPDLSVAVEKLLDIAHTARIQVMHNDLLGTQFYDREEIELQRKVLSLTLEILDRKDKELAEVEAEYDEYENWDDEEENEALV